ncbi:MAG: nuclear transport factor 2 family protein [Candidatus Kaistia colombiensis]|nr:MAG: nuclear transport factor 2 family protein [Kaistia sp.]
MRGAWVGRLAVGLIATGAVCTTAIADEAPDEAAIRARLQAWAAAFNARDAEVACELFAADVISTVRGAPDAGKAAICQRLKRALAQTDRTLTYTPDIEEVFVSGEQAVVRLIWTLKTTRDGTVAVSHEKGMDLFRRDRSGTWRILRFIAFSTENDD